MRTPPCSPAALTFWACAMLCSVRQASAQSADTETAAPEALTESTDVDPAPALGLRGRIVDERTGAGVPDSVVIAQDRAQRPQATAVTDDTGHYELLLSPGYYSLFAYADLYHGTRMRRVRVHRSRWTNLELTLEPIDAEAIAEEVEIVYRADTSSAAAQDQLRVASNGIGEGLGAEQMSQTGAGDAGAAAQNVAGVSLEGTSLNIRGLGGRYTRVLLNGIELPSTDPDLPSVDLDLFPTSVIDNLHISKASLPNLPGNFAGGVLDIGTVRFPRRFTFQLGASLGANSQSTFQDRLTYSGGDLDWLGFDDGTRSLPRGTRGAPLVVTRAGRYSSSSQLEEAAERFENRWQYRRRLSAPGLGVGFTVGDSVDLGTGNRFGFLLSGFYRHSDERRVGTSRPRPTLASDGSLRAFSDYAIETGTEAVQLGSLLTMSLELGQDDSVTLLSLFNRSTTDEAQRQTGVSGELGAGETIERWQLQMLSRSLWFNHLRGDHQNLFGSRLRLRWGAFGSYAAREEPDRRTVTYGPQGGIYRWLEKAQSGERFFSDLGQLDLGATLDLRVPLFSGAWGSIGGNARITNRQFTIRRLRMLQDPSNLHQSMYQAPAETLFGADGIGRLTRIREFTRGTDSYAADQAYYTGYVMLETPLGDRLELTAGARLEVFEQTVQSQSPFGSDGESSQRTDRTDIDILPSAALRLQLAEQVYLRASYGMTVARPQVRELAPYQYYDFVRDRNIQGNPDLERTLVQNADLRWEWFFGDGEIIAVSAFYKYFHRPIELQIFNPGNYDAQFINADYAHNLGAEFEFRFNFRHVHPSLAFLSMRSNVAAIWSSVRLPASLSGAVQAERSLYGQAPYVASLSLEINEPDSGVTAAVVYNVVGPRIADVGTRVNDTILPNVVRAPFHSLNAIVAWRIDRNFRLRLTLRNLLLQTQDHYQGNFLTQRIEPGMSGSLSLRYAHD